MKCLSEGHNATIVGAGVQLSTYRLQNILKSNHNYFIILLEGKILSPQFVYSRTFCVPSSEVPSFHDKLETTGGVRVAFSDLPFISPKTQREADGMSLMDTNAATAETVPQL